MRAWQIIDQTRTQLSEDYAGHQASALDLDRVRSSLHGMRTAAEFVAACLPLTRIGDTLRQIESQLQHAALAEALLFRQRHPLGGSAR